MSIIGRFYFKQTQNGNLLGEFSNSGMTSIDSESATLIPPLLISLPTQKFIGEYNSTWFEDKAKFLALEIKFKYLNNDKIYTIEWKDKSGNPVFKGEGFLVDDILIGDYTVI